MNLQPYIEAIKAGKTLSFHFFEEHPLDLESSCEIYYKLRLSKTDSNTIEIEQKSVTDRGYPSIDIEHDSKKIPFEDLASWLTPFLEDGIEIRC